MAETPRLLLYYQELSLEQPPVTALPAPDPAAPGAGAGAEPGGLLEGLSPAELVTWKIALRRAVGLGL